MWIASNNEHGAPECNNLGTMGESYSRRRKKKKYYM
jgi:hypothetical protein